MELRQIVLGAEAVSDFGENNPKEVLALMKEYGISARLTFSNSLLRTEHLSDKKCNYLCSMFEEKNGIQNGVIIHSDLLLDYLKINILNFILSHQQLRC